MEENQESQSVKILLVEDNPDDIFVFKKVFAEITKVNFELVCADRLQAAIECCGKTKIDVILIDLGLPDSRGIDTFYKLYAQVPDIPILLFSGLDEADTALKAIHEGAQDYLVKHTYTANGLVRAIQYARERHRMLKELARSNRDLGQFAYFAAHDLQSPLRSVTEYLQLLELRYKDKLDVDAHQFINYAVDAAARLKALINNLLLYSQVDNDKRVFAPTDSLQVLQEVLTNLKKIIEETKAVITYDNMPVITADKIQMAQLFQNLIGNALKFRKAQPSIHISAERKRNEWLFSVKDNGIGFDMKYADTIFDSFQRLNSMREYPGTGLGLSICKKIVERRGGRIWADSVPGEGTVFYFTVPEKK